MQTFPIVPFQSKNKFSRINQRQGSTRCFFLKKCWISSAASYAFLWPQVDEMHQKVSAQELYDTVLYSGMFILRLQSTCLSLSNVISMAWQQCNGFAPHHRVLWHQVIRLKSAADHQTSLESDSDIFGGFVTILCSNTCPQPYKSLKRKVFGRLL